MNYFLLSLPFFIQLSVFFSYLTTKKIDKYLMLVISLMFSLFTGLRSLNAGYDTDSYILLFEKMNSYNDIFNGYMSWKGDYFFSLLTLIIKNIFNNPQIFLWLISLISILILNYALLKLYKDEKERFLFLALFYLSYIPVLLYGNVIRQGLAISIFYFALCFLKKRKSIFFLLFLIAILTHKSSLIFILFPLFYLKRNKLNIFKVLPIAIVIKILAFDLLNYVPLIGNKLRFYSASFINTDTKPQIILFLILMFLIINKKLKNATIKNDLIFNLFIYVSIASLLFLDFPKIISRSFIWISPVLPYLIINSFNFYKQKRELKFLFYSVIFISSYFFMMSNQVQFNLTYNF